MTDVLGGPLRFYAKSAGVGLSAQVMDRRWRGKPDHVNRDMCVASFHCDVYPDPLARAQEEAERLNLMLDPRTASISSGRPSGPATAPGHVTRVGACGTAATGGSTNARSEP